MLGLPSTAKTPAVEAQQVKRCGKRATNVPGLAGIELIFYFTAVTVLCSGFRMGMMLLTHCWLSCCWVELALSKEFRVSQAVPGRSCTRSWVGEEPGQLDLNWPFHSTRDRAQQRNWGDLARSCESLGRDRLGITQQQDWASLGFPGFLFIPLSHLLLLLI